MFKSPAQNSEQKSPRGAIKSRNTSRTGNGLEEVKLIMKSKSRQSPDHSFSLASVALRMTLGLQKSQQTLTQKVKLNLSEYADRQPEPFKLGRQSELSASPGALTRKSSLGHTPLFENRFS